MGHMGIALQLYTLREPAKLDLMGTLKRVREIGFEFVQWSGMPPMSAGEIRDALDRAGLTACAAHCPVEPFEEDLAGQVAFWRAVRVRDVAPGSMMADCRDTLAAWREGARRLDALGARLRNEGMRLSYHNHEFEFETFPEDRRCKLDILFEETRPENLFTELDTGWVQAGGADPADYISKYRGRCPLVHVKDILPVRDADGRYQPTELGQGMLDWPAIFGACRAAKVEWCIYEQDTSAGDPFESARVSYEFLRTHLGG